MKGMPIGACAFTTIRFCSVVHIFMNLSIISFLRFSAGDGGGGGGGADASTGAGMYLTFFERPVVCVAVVVSF